MCQFRGRTYKAWYTMEIEIEEGPWKFHGLPGLIVEIADIWDHYHFTLIGMRRENINRFVFTGQIGMIWRT